MTYPEAEKQCDRMGLRIALPESPYENEQDSIFENFNFSRYVSIHSGWRLASIGVCEVLQ